ncbi:hypothetical protein B5X24_HaOG212889 [Helicoverpa armigera]|uniref:RRM domain-containing protein n=1 Tax=Helicoverpa armigera TaxID=29058 RepID=A0A2W1BAA7_HELAM|nr:hypothetical protein B5X24_HaOG212889 [Helicoverpa armigera]
MFSVNQSVDHRPKALLISGFEADELEALITHFSYKSRQHAEHAIANGKHYNDRTLSITWTANTNASANNAARPADARPARNGDQRDDKDEITWTANTNASANNAARPADARPARNGEQRDDKDETPAELPEDTLLRFDEEEEDDADEDRSWRR